MSDVAAPAKAAKGLWGRTKARLGKKLGPLPVWGWMGVGTAGLLAVGQGSKGKQTQAATPAASVIWVVSKAVIPSVSADLGNMA